LPAAVSDGTFKVIVFGKTAGRPRLQHACGAVLLAVLLGSCAAAPGQRELLEEKPVVTVPSKKVPNLEILPPPLQKIDVAIYQFPDLTGKNEPNDNIAVFSRAVTQGGAGLAVDALQRAGQGSWF
jgi:curli production assembly/transport component CsgG